MRFANWSWLMSQVTFGYCFVNSSESLKGTSKPVSKEALSFTGSVPQVGPDAAAAAFGVCAVIERTASMVTMDRMKLILLFMVKSPAFLFRYRNVPVGSGDHPTLSLYYFAFQLTPFRPIGLFD